MELDERYKIINGNSLEVLDTLEENSIDAIITDPPYELGFMGKSWDRSGIAYNVELWKKALRVLKCGGHLLAFGGSRTYHRIACAIEDAGFEIRDTIMWLYGSGFPKSMNIGLMLDKKNGVESTIVGEKGYTVPHYKDLYKIGTDATHERKPVLDKQANNEWNGWGTCLKPAFEPIIVARKPVENSVLENVEKYRVGGINIEECRVGNVGGIKKVDIEPNSGSKNCGFGCNGKREELDAGRFPANVILTYDNKDFDEVCGNMPETSSNASEPNYEFTNQDNPSHLYTNIKSGQHFDDSGNACRYFYCAKASKKDRDSGLIILEEKGAKELLNREEDSDGTSWNGQYSSGNAFAGAGAPKKNIHPTVKPVDLMQYLVRLVSPKGATILDIFNGSGSTGKAVAFENRERDADYKYIGIELDPYYCEISKQRIDYAINQYKYDILEERQENEKIGQLSIFDFIDENDDI